MINFRRLSILSVAFALVSVAHAQLSTSLVLSKTQYLAGEPVIATVNITNHAGQDLTFYGDGRMQWLTFVLKDSHGEEVTPKGKAAFGKVTIKAGASMARQVDLTQIFYLSEPGNFSATALVRMPGDIGGGSSTNRILFNQSPGAPYWKQKVGIPGRAGDTREFRIINFSGDSADQVYAQIIDGRTGLNVRTMLLGEVLMLRKPLVTVDRSQRMHVMYLASPTMWIHCVIDTDGKLVARQIHQRGPQGDPQLLTFADGTVRVSNSIPYDPKAAAEAKAKVRKASDRPPITY
ncbi:MAG: hypothetical protein V4640_10430 [Verrucomicrobiota bacterium]